MTDSATNQKLPQGCPSLRLITMPRDTNNLGSVFGGVILSYIDQAGYIEARKQGPHRWLTVAVEKVVFHSPVFVGDIVSLYTNTKRLGTTSITVDVSVWVERFSSAKIARVTEATLTFVAVNEAGEPTAFGS